MREQSQTEPLRAIFVVFSLLALTAGALLFLGASNTDDLFSWTIKPPLTAATLAAFYWAAVVLMLPLVGGGPWRQARPALYPVATIAVLLLAATLIELDTLDLDSFFGWFWLAAYVVVPPLLALAVLDQLRRPGDDIRDERNPLPVGLRAVLVPEAIALLAIGALLFATPATVNDFWPWPLGDLSSRVLGALVLGIGLAAAVAVRENDLVVFRGSARAYAALGALALLALALHGDDLADDDLATGAYVAALIAILATGIYGSLATSSAAKASARS